MWKIISYLPSFQDNRLHLKRIKQKICLFSLYSTFFLFIKLIFNQILCSFIQISWTKKTFDVDLRFYNEKQSTHGVVYHLSFTSSLFFKMLFSYFFPLITYHMNYQISVDSHDRSNTFYSSFSSYSTRRHIRKWTHGKKIFVCNVHANTLIAFMKERYTNILNIYSFSKVYSTLKKNVCYWICM